MSDLKEIGIYIAGPMCFKRDGYAEWNAMRRLAEIYGFSVTLPNDQELVLDHDDPRVNADTIFANCAESMNRSAAIIVDLELFRGSEPDGGSVYELGMAFARGLRCYAFTRDKRSMVFKHQNALIKDGQVCDEQGRILPYQDLPFCPAITSSSRIVEGNYEDCLKLLKLDLEDEIKRFGQPLAPTVHPALQVISSGVQSDQPAKLKVLLTGPERYENDAAAIYADMARMCEAAGLEPILPKTQIHPIDVTKTADPLHRAYRQFTADLEQIAACDLVLANLNDFQGWEPSSETAFMCGAAFQLGKKLYGYMNDTTIMKHRIPNFGEGSGFRDLYDYNVENFDYPINLMFASSMKIFEGDFGQVVNQVTTDLKESN